MTRSTNDRYSRPYRRILYYRYSLAVSFTSFSIIVLVMCMPVLAGSFSWNAPAGQPRDWFNHDNWVPDFFSAPPLPTSATGAGIYNGGTATIASMGAVCSSLGLGGLSGGNIQMTSGSLTVANGESITNGTFVQSGGTNSASSLQLASGTYSLTANGLLSVTDLSVGNSDTGAIFTQSGGTASASALRIGTSSFGAKSGSCNLSGDGVLSASSQYVGYEGSGTFVQSGGMNYASTLWVGYNAGRSGTYNLNAGGLSSVTTLYVGYSGGGVFTQSGGTNSLSAPLCLGYNAGSSGTYNLSGGTLIVPSMEQGAGSAVFNFVGGTLQANDAFSTTVPLTLGTSGGGATFDTVGFVVTLAGQLSGTGSLTKTGGGTLILASSNTYTGGTVVSQGILQGNVSSLRGNITNNAMVVFEQLTPGTYSGVMSGSGSLVKLGADKLTLTGNNTYTGDTAVSSGTLEIASSLSAATGRVRVASGAALIVGASLPRAITGVGSDCVIVVSATDVTLGDSTSYAGFSSAGTLAVGTNSVSLCSRGFANLGSLTTLAGGLIIAPNGVSIGVGGNLVGLGTVQGKVAAAFGSTISATGNLTLGDDTKPNGFYSDGELYTNGYTITLNAAATTTNRNAVVLGAITKVDGGSLVASNGVLLENGKSVVSDVGGLVSKGAGPSGSRFLNRGTVQGPSASTNDWLTFDLLFKGSTGQTSGNIAFLGGYSPGDSPAINVHEGNAILNATSAFDIGGTVPGSGSGHFSQLRVTGSLNFESGASLFLSPWEGFLPKAGDTFEILAWTGSLSGTAAILADPSYTANGIQFSPTWGESSLVVTAVPEPSAVALLGVGAIGCAGFAWRKRLVKRGVAIAAMLCVVCLAGAEVDADTFGAGANQFTLDFVNISGATNPTSGYGVVNNDYRMGTYEITNDQWNRFVANVGGTVVGYPTTAYDATPYYKGANQPANNVSWYEAAQFVNWLNTSTGHQAAYKFTGTPGTSNYTFDKWIPAEATGSNLYRNKDAFYFLPTKDEWVKAAYWNGKSLQTYASQNGAEPVARVDSNYGLWNDQPWAVGSGVEELNGTYDMMGNVWEWMESPYSDNAYDADSARSFRGGSFPNGYLGYLASSYGGVNYYYGQSPSYEVNDIGFRVASVPEPSSVSLLVVAVTGLLCWRRGR